MKIWTKIEKLWADMAESGVRPRYITMNWKTYSRLVMEIMEELEEGELEYWEILGDYVTHYKSASIRVDNYLDDSVVYLTME